MRRYIVLLKLLRQGLTRWRRKSFMYTVRVFRDRVLVVFAHHVIVVEKCTRTYNTSSRADLGGGGGKTRLKDPARAIVCVNPRHRHRRLRNSFSNVASTNNNIRNYNRNGDPCCPPRLPLRRSCRTVRENTCKTRRRRRRRQ